jgi:5-methyltetrahydropteroyltriglutamate--homocysteine methyltransferase
VGDEATRLAIGDMERAGIDIIVDGEIRRESYSNRLATALSGVDLDNPATIMGRTGGTVVVPRIVGPIRRRGPVEVRDVEFLRANTDRKIKITLPWPVYDVAPGQERVLQGRGRAGHGLRRGGQCRDPRPEGGQRRCDPARRVLALPAIDRPLDGILGPTALHLCFGYAYVARDKPNRYAFLPELTASKVDQISIEAAQPISTSGPSTA